MKKRLVTFTIICLTLIFSACGSNEKPPKAGELKEINKKTLLNLLDNDKAQPFLFISTDASEDLFLDTAKPIFEDYLEQSNVGAYYLNVNELSSKEIEEVNSLGSNYDASSDGLVLIRNGEIEKITSRIVFNQNTLSNKEEHEIFEEGGFEKQLHKDINNNVTEVVDKLLELN